MFFTTTVYLIGMAALEIARVADASRVAPSTWEKMNLFFIDTDVTSAKIQQKFKTSVSGKQAMISVFSVDLICSKNRTCTVGRIQTTK